MIRVLNFFDSFSVQPLVGDKMDEFVETYLSDLKTWTAYAGFREDGTISGIIGFQRSTDTTEFYITFVRGVDLEPVLAKILEDLEPLGYDRFYRLQYLDRDDFWDFIVPNHWEYSTAYTVEPKKKTPYNKHWFMLYDSELPKKNTAVKLAVLKKEFRKNLTLGNI